MNATLPTAIESYLLEAGFSATEMLVLRNLVEGVPLSLRELAVKTGKSTGVLDQSMKKLLRKEIAEKQTVNGHPKYAIHSLDAVVRWVKKDMQQRKEVLDRRHQNFEQFIASLKIGSKKPDVEYFHGIDGMKQLYLKLIETRQELITFTPIIFTAEEDPLRNERVELFRKRQYHKIFHRVIAPDTMLARRFQSRDPFEYRKTMLLPETELPLQFEKTVAGDYIACINVEENTGCLFKYPELAKNERAVFESVWARAKMMENAPASVLEAETIPLKTRFLSQLREFIVSRKSIVAFAIFAIIAGVMTFGLYQNNRNLNLKRIQDKVLAIASTGVLQFDAKDIDAVWTQEDVDKPEYVKLVATLNMIRRSNADIQFVYLMRKTSDPKKLSFVADADGIYANQNRDLNNDGIVNDADEVSYPGQLYDDDEYPLISTAFEKPLVAFGTDQWGTFISSQAAVRDSSGNSVAVLGVDMFADKLDDLSATTFAPLYVFIGLFSLFIVIRFSAINRSLLREIGQKLMDAKSLFILWLFFIILIISISIISIHKYTKNLEFQKIGEKLMAIAVTAAQNFNSDDLNKIHWARDMKTVEYQKIFKKLNEIRSRNVNVTYAYIIRPLSQDSLYEYIADADANFNLPQRTKSDVRDISDLTFSDENVWPGYIYDDLPFHVYKNANKRPIFNYLPIDKWGSAIIGCAPIIEKNSTIAIFCVDSEIENKKF